MARLMDADPEAYSYRAVVTVEYWENSRYKPGETEVTAYGPYSARGPAAAMATKKAKDKVPRVYNPETKTTEIAGSATGKPQRGVTIWEDI
jgi:hypothetical protein